LTIRLILFRSIYYTQKIFTKESATLSNIEISSEISTKFDFSTGSYDKINGGKGGARDEGRYDH
jgi:hypothetical protein